MRLLLGGITIALAGVVGCVAAPMQPAPEQPAAAKAEGELGTQPPRGAVYHPRGADGYDGVGVVPYAGNRLGVDPYTSEQDFY